MGGNLIVCICGELGFHFFPALIGKDITDEIQMFANPLNTVNACGNIG